MDHPLGAVQGLVETMNRKAVFLTLGMTLAGLMLLSLASILVKVSIESENRLKEAGAFESTHLVTDSFQRAYGRLILDNFGITVSSWRDAVQITQLLQPFSTLTSPTYTNFNHFAVQRIALVNYTNLRWSGLKYITYQYDNDLNPPNTGPISIFAKPINLSYTYLYFTDEDSNPYQIFREPVENFQPNGNAAKLEDTPALIFLLNEPFPVSSNGRIHLNVTVTDDNVSPVLIDWKENELEPNTEKLKLKISYTFTKIPITVEEENDISFTPETGDLSQIIYLNGTESLLEPEELRPVIEVGVIGPQNAGLTQALLLANFRTNMTITVTINLTSKEAMRSSFYSYDNFTYNAGPYNINKSGPIRIWPY